MHPLSSRYGGVKCPSVPRRYGGNRSGRDMKRFDAAVDDAGNLPMSQLGTCRSRLIWHMWRQSGSHFRFDELAPQETSAFSFIFQAAPRGATCPRVIPGKTAAEHARALVFRLLNGFGPSFEFHRPQAADAVSRHIALPFCVTR